MGEFGLGGDEIGWARNGNRDGHGKRGRGNRRGEEEAERAGEINRGEGNSPGQWRRRWWGKRRWIDRLMGGGCGMMQEMRI